MSSAWFEFGECTVIAEDNLNYFFQIFQPGPWTLNMHLCIYIHSHVRIVLAGVNPCFVSGLWERFLLTQRVRVNFFYFYVVEEEQGRETKVRNIKSIACNEFLLFIFSIIGFLIRYGERRIDFGIFK